MAHTVIYGKIRPENINDPETYSALITDSLGKLILSEDSDISATITNEFATEATLDLVKDSVIDIDNVLTTIKTDTETITSYLNDINLNITTCNTSNVTISSSVLPVGASTEAEQQTTNGKLNTIDSNIDTIKTTINNIKLDTANLVRVAPTDNNVTEAIPVRLMVGTSGSAFNALRSNGSDLSVFIDDINPDVATNSGLSTKAEQQTTNGKLTTIKSALDDINVGLNKTVINQVVYTSQSVTAGTASTSIIMGVGKDRYNTIQIIGDTETNGYRFILQFSIDGTNFYSDGVENSNYDNGTRYEFSVSRLNISTPYVRIYSTVSGSTVNMSYSVSKE